MLNLIIQTGLLATPKVEVSENCLGITAVMAEYDWRAANVP